VEDNTNISGQYTASIFRVYKFSVFQRRSAFFCTMTTSYTTYLNPENRSTTFRLDVYAHFVILHGARTQYELISTNQNMFNIVGIYIVTELRVQEVSAAVQHTCSPETYTLPLNSDN
jgi:hypothetical protein